MIWEIDFDLAIWLEVPDLTGAEADGWVERAAAALVKDFTANGSVEAGYGELVRHQLAVLAQLAHSKAATYGTLLAHLPGPEYDPFPVFVAFREPQGKSPDYLLEIAGATDMPAVQPPAVDYLVTDDLGDGVRVLRYEDDAELGLVANLCYAWRAYDTDVFIFAQTEDLARLEQVMPDIAALASAIRPVSATQAHDGA